MKEVTLNVKRLVRWFVAVPAAGQVNYKCSGCGKTAQAGASEAAPSC